MSEDERYFDGVVPVWDAIACELKDTSPEGSWLLTKILLIANAILFIVLGQYMWPYTTAYQTFPYPACVLSGTCWSQIVNGMFAHADFPHIIGNMFFLYIVGDNVEITFGRLKYLIIYFTSGIAAAFTQSMYSLAISPNTLGVLMVGASGAISGLIGAYLLTYPGSAMCYCIGFRFIFKCFRVRATTYLGLWILFQFVYPLIVSNVAIVAHLGGLVTGAALALLLANRERIEDLRVRMWRGFIRGLDPGEDELRRHSLSAVGAGALVVAALFLIGVSAIAAYNAPAYDGRYAVVYGITERVLVSYSVPSPIYTWPEMPPYGHVTYEPEPTYVTRVREVRLIFTSNLTIVERVYTWPDTVVFAVLRTDFMAEVTATAAVATIAASSYLIYAVVGGKHREVEVTYVSPEMVRRLRAAPS